MKLIQYPQETCDKKIKDEIIALEQTAWPQEGEKVDFPSAPNTYVTSFVLFDQEQAVCHVGIRKSRLNHKGNTYMAYGLSEVVTHPDYQKKGLATETIRKAAEYMIAEQPDILIFTCAKERVAFYTRCGFHAVPGAHFVGGTKEKPFRSEELGLVTMMRFLSEKSREHEKDFEYTEIVFELGEGQLW